MYCGLSWPMRISTVFNALRPRQNVRHFADDSFKYISLSGNKWMTINISLKFALDLKGRINNIQALVQIMAWCRPGDKPLSEAMTVSVLLYMSHSASMRKVTDSPPPPPPRRALKTNIRVPLGLCRGTVKESMDWFDFSTNIPLLHQMCKSWSFNFSMCAHIRFCAQLASLLLYSQ